jgi:hypothetical protein
MHGRTGGDRVDAPTQSIFVCIDTQIDPQLRRENVAVNDHLVEIPGGGDMQERKGRIGRIESLSSEMQHRRRIFSDRIKEDRIAELRHHLAHDFNGFRLQPPQMGRQPAATRRPIGLGGIAADRGLQRRVGGLPERFGEARDTCIDRCMRRYFLG